MNDSIQKTSTQYVPFLVGFLSSVFVIYFGNLLAGLFGIYRMPFASHGPLIIQAIISALIIGYGLKVGRVYWAALVILFLIVCMRLIPLIAAIIQGADIGFWSAVWERFFIMWPSSVMALVFSFGIAGLAHILYRAMIKEPLRAAVQ